MPPIGFIIKGVAPLWTHPAPCLHYGIPKFVIGATVVSVAPPCEFGFADRNGKGAVDMRPGTRSLGDREYRLILGLSARSCPLKLTLDLAGKWLLMVCAAAALGI